MKKQTAFDIAACGNIVAESIGIMTGGDVARAILNDALKGAYIAKVVWGKKSSDEGTLANAVRRGLEVRGLTPDSLKPTLSTIKWCFEQGVQVNTLNVGRMKDQAAKGLAFDLVTGKPKTVKAKGKSAPRAKSEATVKHCGYGLLSALEAEGFGKWIVHFLNVMDIKGHDSTDLVELIMDDARQALRDCGFATQDDKGNLVATVIKESDNEADE